MFPARNTASFVVMTRQQKKMRRRVGFDFLQTLPMGHGISAREVVSACIAVEENVSAEKKGAPNRSETLRCMAGSDEESKWTSRCG